MPLIANGLTKKSKLQKKYNKPIIAVEPFASEKTSKVVRDAATVIVGWRASSIANAVRIYAL